MLPGTLAQRARQGHEHIPAREQLGSGDIAELAPQSRRRATDYHRSRQVAAMDPLVAGESARSRERAPWVGGKRPHGAFDPWCARPIDGGRPEDDCLNPVLLVRASNQILSLDLAERITPQVVIASCAQR